MTEASHRRTSIWFIAYALGPLVIATTSRRPLVDNSFLWHITAGSIQWADGAVLTADPFSFLTLGEPWRTQSWIMDLLYDRGVETFGVAFGQAIPVIFGWLLFLVIAVVVRSQVATGPGSALIMALSVITLLPFLQPRPVISSYVLLALLVLASLRDRLLWTIPLIIWIWASVHGSFFLGFVFLGTEWFRTRRTALFKVTAVSLLTASLTAHGVSLWGVILDFAQGRGALSMISEWQPPHLLDLKFLPIFVALVAIVLHFSRTGGLTARVGLPLLAWIAFGLTAKRSMPLLWIVLLPVAAMAVQTVLAGWHSSASMRRRTAYLLTGCMMAVPLAAPGDEALDETRFPVDAARVLTAERVFHDDVVGGYLIYDQWPARLVYVDDRAELFGERLVEFAEARSGGPGWRETLDAARVEQALVRREDAIASLLEESDEWRLTYEDHTFLVYDRLGESG